MPQNRHGHCGHFFVHCPGAPQPAQGGPAAADPSCCTLSSFACTPWPQITQPPPPDTLTRGRAARLPVRHVTFQLRQILPQPPRAGLCYGVYRRAWDIRGLVLVLPSEGRRACVCTTLPLVHLRLPRFGRHRLRRATTPEPILLAPAPLSGGARRGMGKRCGHPGEATGRCGRLSFLSCQLLVLQPDGLWQQLQQTGPLVCQRSFDNCTVLPRAPPR